MTIVKRALRVEVTNDDTGLLMTPVTLYLGEMSDTHVVAIQRALTRGGAERAELVVIDEPVVRDPAQDPFCSYCGLQRAPHEMTPGRGGDQRMYCENCAPTFVKPFDVETVCSPEESARRLEAGKAYIAKVTKSQP